VRTLFKGRGLLAQSVLTLARDTSTEGQGIRIQDVARMEGGWLLYLWPASSSLMSSLKIERSRSA
jgi:hypothetical protein